jgi:hypothetical protein
MDSMNDKKTWASTVAGWFIERDESPVAEITSEPGEVSQSPSVETFSSTTADSYTTPSPTQTVFQKDPPRAAGGQVDFAAVFEAAGVDADEQQRVARTTDLLRSLPAETDAAIKKQIVEASLKAFGVPIEKIIGDR